MTPLPGETPVAATAGSSADGAGNGCLTVYDFHRTGRCPACLAMEEWTREVVGSGALRTTQWRVARRVGLRCKDGSWQQVFSGFECSHAFYEAGFNQRAQEIQSALLRNLQAFSNFARTQRSLGAKHMEQFLLART